MGSEVTRASDADRERYAEHLSYLFAEGYIRTRSEADQLRGQLLEARSIKVLNDTMSGFPLPPMPPQRRDWGIPERWAPVTIAAGALGILTAAVPTTALAHRDDSLSNALVAAFFALGMIIVVVAAITALCAGISWDSIGQSERERRRSMDRNRRVKQDRDR